MNENYMIYPLKHMRITCRYDEASHRKHCVNVADGKVDYPIDDGGKDAGRDPIYCPCDEMKVTAIKGIGNGSTNTIWLVSTTKVITPTFTDIAFMTLTHSNDNDLDDIKVGDIFKRGEIICYEGNDGTTANHIHLTCGRGSSDNWTQNSNGSWVMVGDTKRPEDVFYIDRSFTEEIWGGYLIWNDLPLQQIQKVGTPVKRNTKVDQIEVLVDNLNARSEANITLTSNGYINRGIYNVINQTDNDGYHFVQIENYWIATNDEWTIYYPKEIKVCEETSENVSEIYPKLIFTCSKTGKYLIYLEQGDKLYLK